MTPPPASRHSGLFGPASVTWRVAREAALLLAGGRALLMQIAHPGVAAGVAEHSDFRERPQRRLERTLGLTLAMTFGERSEALAAARTINRTHLAVRGAGYSAQDTELKLWVHATMIDSSVVGYRTFVGPLSRADQEEFYRESQRVGALLGIPAGAYPEGLDEFEAYLARTCRERLAVDERALGIARAVLRAPVRIVLPGAPTAALAHLTTAGLLPPPLRRAFRLRWGRRERAAFRALAAGLPRLLPLLPDRVRYSWPALRGYPER